jgi:flavin-dependent dehydrogenase
MYDAIVVGARCAGSPTAMLLARQGLRVLLVDKASFPSDTLSTHYLHPPALDILRGWNLLDRVERCGAPPIERLTWRYRDLEIAGFPVNPYGMTAVYAPRRYVFDMILLSAALEAGVEFRDRFAVQELVRADSGRVTGIKGRYQAGATVVEKAGIVVGADGMRSLVARQAGAITYRLEATLTCQYYGYWAGVDGSDNELLAGDWLGSGAIPTNDGLTTICVACPRSSLGEFRKDVAGNFLRIVREVSPDLADRVSRGERVERIYGTADIPNFIRRPYGSGWALVGDSGYHKDPLTAAGITDAFRDANLLTEAIMDGLTGMRDADAAMKEYELRRNESVMPFFQMTLDAATLEPPRGKNLDFMRALQGNQSEIDRWLGMNSYTVPVDEVLSPQYMDMVINAAAICR